MDYYASSSEEGDVEAVASPAVEPCAPASSCGIEGLPAHAAASSRQEADAADAIDGADAATAARSKPVDVGPSSTLSAEGARLHVTIEGRYLTILRWKGELHAIDSICFHAGGPLGVGDIEDVNGKPCIVCPWHYYQVDLATGDKYYQSIKFEDGKMKKGDWCSNGVKQRVHSVAEEGDRILVTLSQGEAIESDKYAFNVPCGERMKGRDSKSTRNQQGVGADGKLPSGHIFQRAQLGRPRGR